MFQPVKARSGDFTFSVNNKYIHSKYDPRKEARRYLASYSLEEKSVCILIEPGLDYLSEAIHYTYPHVQTVSLHCIESIKYYTSSSGAALYLSDHRSIHSFLAAHIEDAQLASLRIIRWEPSALACPEEVRSLEERVYDYIRMRNASINTTGLFGPLWLKRRIRSFLDLHSLVVPQEETRPVVIAASGPSLDTVLPALHTHRDSLALWALSSALKPLSSYGMVPDIIFHSDGGFYSHHHLHPLKRDLRQSIEEEDPPVIASPLTAAIDHELSRDFPRMLLLSESPIEGFLLSAFDLPALATPSHGTVSGTAYYCASNIADGEVYFTGLDLAFEDIKAHAGDHAFYPLLLSGTDRFRPLHSIYFERSPIPSGARRLAETDWIQSAAIETYARWFASRAPKGFLRIEPSAVELPPFTPLSAEEFAGRIFDSRKPRKRQIHIEAPPLGLRLEKAKELVEVIREGASELSTFKDPSQADTFIRSAPLIEEVCRESNMSAFLRLRRSLQGESLSELIDSLYSSAQNLETIIYKYGKQ